MRTVNLCIEISLFSFLAILCNVIMTTASTQSLGGIIDRRYEREKYVDGLAGFMKDVTKRRRSLSWRRREQEQNPHESLTA